jgi:hypothetical protein
MKTNIKYNISLFFLLLFVVLGCSEENYSLVNLTAPSNVVITADVVGKDALHPEGDGSGNVNFMVTGNNILGSKIDYDVTNSVDWVILPSDNKVTGTFKTEMAGLNTYTVTVVASGVGGTLTTVTTTVTVLTLKKDI